MAETVQETRPPDPPAPQVEIPRQTDSRPTTADTDGTGQSQADAKATAASALKDEHANATAGATDSGGGRSLADGKDSLQPSTEFQSELAASQNRMLDNHASTTGPAWGDQTTQPSAEQHPQETTQAAQEPGDQQAAQEPGDQQTAQDDTTGQQDQRTVQAQDDQQASQVPDRLTAASDHTADTDKLQTEQAETGQAETGQAEAAQGETAQGEQADEHAQATTLAAQEHAAASADLADTQGQAETEAQDQAETEAQGQTEAEAQGQTEAEGQASGETDVQAPADIVPVEQTGEAARAGSGGDWQTIDEQPGGAVGQIRTDSCVSACGEMVSGRPQQELIGALHVDGLWGATTDGLGKELGDGWKGIAVDPDSDVVPALSATGPWVAQLKGSDPKPHAVVVDGVDADAHVMIRDPWDGGSTYKMDMGEFQRVWTGWLVYNPTRREGTE